MLCKIVSGGQTGVDQGALDAAIERDFPCGGWCPKGRKSEDGEIPYKYPLEESSSSSYPVRTRKNVQDSDGTLILCYGEVSGGTKLTVDIAKAENKPYYIVDLSLSGSTLCVWLAEQNIRTLNVAGPRESKSPGIQEVAREYVVGLLTVVDLLMRDL